MAMTFVVGGGSHAQSLARSLREIVPASEPANEDALTVIDAPRRRIGDRIADLLDGRVDVLRLRPQITATGNADGTWSMERLRAVAGEAVAAHNRPRIATFRAAFPERRRSVVGPHRGGPPARDQRVLTRVGR
ncbi:hypothetical protein AB5I41_24935 [Sphingomonas sp. MMS24-JH45]